MLVLLLQILSFSLYAQSTIAGLNAELEGMYKKYKLPGFSIVIVHNNKILYENGYGYADIKTKTPFTPATIQNIGSVSKTFVAVAMMKAIEQGYFTLETNINDILPFKVSNPYFPDDTIRVRHLVTHTSGIVDRDEVYNRCYIWHTSNISVLQGLLPPSDYAKIATGPDVDTTLKGFMYAYLSPAGKLFSRENFYTNKPGARSAYSNIAAALAAYLIECKAGMPFDEYSDRFVLKPLKMAGSGWSLNSIDLQKHASLYNEEGKAFPMYHLVTYPDGGLRTSADELGKYMIGMIKGFYGKSDILSQKHYREMFSPQLSAANPPENIDLSHRNKGVFWNLYKNGYIGHTGGDPGVSTCLSFNPQTKTGFAFLTNIMTGNETISREVQSIQKVLEDFCNNISMHK